MTDNQAVALVKDELFGQWLTERRRLDRIDRWLRWEHDSPHKPRQATTEYRELAERAQTPWLDLVVTSVAQSLYVTGHRRPKEGDESPSWRLWQANGLDAGQIAVHRAALGYGSAYMMILPGQTMTGAVMPSMRGVSPRHMMAFYDDPSSDELPMYAIDVRRAGDDLAIRLIDDELVHHIRRPSAGGVITYEWSEKHGVNVCPVVRFCNRLDLEGRTDGEVEPFIPVAARIDQTTFDRLVVQRFAAFVVRTVTGMSIEESAAKQGLSTDEMLVRLRVGGFLGSPDENTKFGSLPASPLEGFISAHEADVRALAAVTQTPAHELLGQLANLSAEALAAARASLTAKVEERKYSFGESWEQALRLAAWVAGDVEASEDYDAEVRWKDTEIRSLSQAVDALGKLAQMLGVPVEVLWEKVPILSAQDIERARDIVAATPGLDSDFARLLGTADDPLTMADAAA